MSTASELTNPNHAAIERAMTVLRERRGHLFLTGRAGTGKTYFLNRAREELTEAGRNVAVVAPSGVAAINARGHTIHSFLRVKPQAYAPDGPELNENFHRHFSLPPEGKEIVRALDLLFIDEVSMVRADLLDVVDTVLRRVRKRPQEVFGGVQLCLIGDAFQLPPVVTDQAERALLADHYTSLFFFSARCFSAADWTAVELPTVMRQRDRQFVDVLNRIRTGAATTDDLALLNSRVVAGEALIPQREDRVLLTPRRDTVAERNAAALANLRGEAKLFHAQITGDFPPKDMPTEQRLVLKIGALVMFLVNAADQSYYNGRVGIVQQMGPSSVTVVTEIGQPIEVSLHTWHNVRYTYDRDERRLHETTIGTFRQLPLRLAYAITVHKSQGLTLDHALVDLTTAFEDGMAYVALSRVRHFGGLQLTAPIEATAIRVNPAAIAFQRWVDGQRADIPYFARSRVPRFPAPQDSAEQHSPEAATPPPATETGSSDLADLHRRITTLEARQTELEEVLKALRTALSSL